MAGTQNPATGPLAGNSIVDPGEGARIRIGVTALINGTNAVGQTTTFTNPAPGGTGTVRGLSAFVYDLVGDLNSPSAFGSWHWLTHGEPPMFYSGHPPIVRPGGAAVVGFGGSQFVAPGGSANPANNNIQVMRGVWTPSDYSHRSVNFLARTSELVPPGFGSSVLLAYGQDSAIDPNTQEPFIFDRLVSKSFSPDFGSGLNIPIAPAPSSLALLALAASFTDRRRFSTSTPSAHRQTRAPAPAPSETPARSAP